MRRGVRTFLTVAALLLQASASPLPAEEPCPSAEACLARSLDRNWEQYSGLIEQTWAERTKVAALLKRAEALGRTDLIDKLKGEQAKIQERWQFAEAVARTLTTPSFKGFLARQREEARRTHAVASLRAKKETELYRRLLKGTLGAERDSVLRDMGAYAQEAKELRKAFLKDGLMVSASAAKESVSMVRKELLEWSKAATSSGLAEGPELARAVPYLKAMEGLNKTAQAGFEAVHAGQGVEEATRKNQNFVALLEATKGASQNILHAAELLAKTPDNPLKASMMRNAFGPLAARTGLYANLLALGLDTALTLEAVHRLKQTEARQLVVEADDAHWRTRVEVAARAAGDAAARENRAIQQMDHQRRLEAMFATIQKEGQ